MSVQNAMNDYRRLIEYRTNRATTDGAMLTMQDAKIITAVYSGGIDYTPNMYCFLNNMPYDARILLLEIDSISMAWLQDARNGTVNMDDARLVIADLEVLYTFVYLLSGM